MIFEGLQDDVRLAWRGMRRAKGFSAAAILTLAMGIAGSTVMLALVQGVLLRQLPVRDQDEILVAWKELKASGYAHYPFGDDEIKDVERASRLLQTVAGVTANGFSPWVVIDEAGSGYVKGALVTGRFFDVLGMEPVLGRTLEASDDVDGAENVVVIGSGLWRRRYGASPDIIGRRITLDEQPFTIVGVMPPDVDYPRQVELWRTTRSVPISGAFGDAARQEVDLIARRRPDVTLEQAAGELDMLTRQFEARDPKAPRGLTPVVRPFAEMIVGNVGPVMIAFVVAVGIVLLIASANVANLLLLRGEARRPEFAVREALGAGRRRIVRQLMMESVVLTVAAAAVGLLVAWWSLQSLVTLIPDGLPRLESIRIDAVVVMLTLAVAFVTSLLAGVVPAMLATRVDIASQLRSGSRGVRYGCCRATGAPRPRRDAGGPRRDRGCGGRAAGANRAPSSVRRHRVRGGSPGVRGPDASTVEVLGTDPARAVPRRAHRVTGEHAGDRGGDASQRVTVLRGLGFAAVHGRRSERGSGCDQPFTQPRSGARESFRNAGHSNSPRACLHEKRSQRCARRRDCQRRRGGADVARTGSYWEAPEDGRRRRRTTHGAQWLASRRRCDIEI